MQASQATKVTEIRALMMKSESNQNNRAQYGITSVNAKVRDYSSVLYGTYKKEQDCPCNAK